MHLGLKHTAFRHQAILVAIVILCGMLLMINVSQPWVGLDGTAGVKRSIEAKNYLHYGFLALKFGQANTYHTVSSLGELTYYMHHPPLTSIMIAASFFLFGISELSYRVLFIALTLCSVLMFHAITRRCYGERIALTATFIYAVLPATTFFGRSNYEPTTQFFILLSVWFYLKWLENRRAARFGLFIAVYAAALLTDWPAYFLGGLLPLHFMLTEKGGLFRNREVILIPVVTVGMFALFVYYVYLVDPKAVESFFLQGRIYIGAVTDSGQIESLRRTAAHGGEHLDFTAGQYVRVLLNRFLALHLYPVLVLAAFGVWRLVKNLKERASSRADHLLLVFLALPTAYCVIFYRSAFIHWVWIFYFAAPLAMLASLGIESIASRVNMKNDRPTPLPYVFFVILIILPAVVNLKELHGMQRKVLPGEQHETVGLVPGIAAKLKTLSAGGDLVLTNLDLDHAGLKGGPMLHYYAERRILGNMRDILHLKEQLAQAGENRSYFLLWIDRRDECGDSGLKEYLEQNFPHESFAVAGQTFNYFSLR